jgi:protease secretion system outer membrane protein
MKRLVLLLGYVFVHLNGWAGNLQKTFDAALAYDSQYRSARAELSSTRLSAPMARAALLPNVSISWSDTSVKGSLTNDSGGQTSGRDLDYRSPLRNLSLRMPLYNREASQRVQIADYQVTYGEMLFAQRTADLLDRVASTYFQLLLARLAVTSALAQHESAVAQRNQAKRAFELGDGTRTNAQEAEASLSLSNAFSVESQNQLIQAELGFEQIAGFKSAELNHAEDPLADAGQIKAKQLLKVSLQELLDKANTDSPSIAAKRVAVELAHATVARNGAGHYPRLDFIASATTSRNESINTLNQTIEQQSLGLQLNLPIYSGGYISTSVAQAVADLEKAQADLDSEKIVVTRAVTKSYFAASDASAKVSAYEKILEAQYDTLEGLRRGQIAGLVAATEVTIAEAKATQAKADTAKAYSEFLLAHIQLITKTGGKPYEAIKAIEDIAITAP